MNFDSLYCKHYNPDQGAIWSAFTVFVYIVEVVIYAGDIPSRQHFQEKNLLENKG